MNLGAIQSDQEERSEEIKDVVEFDSNVVAESLDEFALGAA